MTSSAMSINGQSPDYEEVPFPSDIRKDPVRIKVMKNRFVKVWSVNQRRSQKFVEVYV